MRRRRGFTLTEILVASTLAMIFAALIAQTISAGVRLNLDTTSRVGTEIRAREAFRTTTTALRGAVPLGRCELPVGETVITNCLKVGTDLYPIVHAGPDTIVFYSFRDAATAVTEAPQLLRLAFTEDAASGTTSPGNDIDFGTFMLTSWKPGSGNYINAPAGWPRVPCKAAACIPPSGSPEQLRIGQIPLDDESARPTDSTTGVGIPGCEEKLQIFRFYDITGKPLNPSVVGGECRLDEPQLRQIALVLIEADLTYDRRGELPGILPLRAAVNISATNYARAEVTTP
jgi:hypothetical protein